MTLATILGIDAAWTDRQPSGVALLHRLNSEWRCIGLAPSYEQFVELPDSPVRWQSKPRGSLPDINRLLEASQRLLGSVRVAVISIDMPVSRAPIIGRRTADSAISQAFGAAGYSTHSPSTRRPGRIGSVLRAQCEVLGYDVATTSTPSGTPDVLLEVYPHPSLLRLMGCKQRLPYKVGRSKRYWPNLPPTERIEKLVTTYREIAAALKQWIADIDLEPPKFRSAML